MSKVLSMVQTLVGNLFFPGPIQLVVLVESENMFQFTMTARNITDCRHSQFKSMICGQIATNVLFFNASSPF